MKNATSLFVQVNFCKKNVLTLMEDMPLKLILSQTENYTQFLVK